jgi:hypothetical protein
VTIEEAFLRVPGRLLIHKGQVFFNTRDSNVRDEWEELGALCVPFYDEEQMELREKKGRPLDAQGWEVHLLGAIDPIWIEDTDGDELNVTRDVLLQKARELVAA